MLTVQTSLRWLAFCSRKGTISPRMSVQVKHVEAPHPEWKPGMKQPRPDYIGQEDNYITLDPAELGNAGYPLVISAIAPRPIAFIVSQDKEGQRNLSPYSYFQIMSHDPPMVCIGPNRTPARQDGMKDAESNILATKQFTLNMISNWFVEAANYTCTPFEHGVDEMDFVGLTPIPSQKVKPPRVKESAVQMECELRHNYEIKNKDGKVTANILIAEVLLWHIHEGVAGRTPHSNNLVVDLDKYQPISRLGGISYGRVTETFDLPRPDAEKALKDREREGKPKGGKDGAVAGI